MKSNLTGMSALGLGALVFASLGLQHRWVHAAGSPPGKYPETEATMAAMQAAANNATIRAHAWAILSHFTNGGTSETPAWEGTDWEGKCKLGLGNSFCDAPNPTAAAKLLLESPPQARIGVSGQPSPASPAFDASAVLYNKSAADFIRTHKLAWSDTWKTLNKQPDSDSIQSSLRFPSDAVIVKEIWENVTICTPGAQGMDACPARIYVWDPTIVTNNAQPPNQKFPPVSDWTSSMLPVDTDPIRDCLTNKKYHYYPQTATPPKTEWIPIKCFHYRQIDPGVDASMPFRTGTLQGTSTAPPLKSYIVLVGFHVITAELPDWTWNTFWWTKPDVDTGRRKDHPKEIADHLPWSLYSMETTLSATTPVASDHGPRIVYNPYLEGQQPNGPVSNCIACHSHAVYRNQTAPYADGDFKGILKPRCLLLDPKNTACTSQAFQSDDDFFRSATKTHFLWSIAVKQDPAASINSNNLMMGPK